MLLLLVVQMVYVTMVYGPIRVSGRALPLIATAVTTSDWAKSSFGDSADLTGLIYPIAVCVLTVLVGTLTIRETREHRLDQER